MTARSPADFSRMCTSEKSLQQHLRSKRHLKNIRRQQVGPLPPTKFPKKRAKKSPEAIAKKSLCEIRGLVRPDLDSFSISSESNGGPQFIQVMPILIWNPHGFGGSPNFGVPGPGGGWSAPRILRNSSRRRRGKASPWWSRADYSEDDVYLNLSRIGRDIEIGCSVGRRVCCVWRCILFSEHHVGTPRWLRNSWYTSLQ